MNLQPSTAAARHAMKRRIQLSRLRRCARTGSPVLNSDRVRRSIWADAALLLAALYSSAWLLLESEQVGLLYEFSGCRVCCVCVCVTCGSFACAYLLAADPDPCPHFPALHDICSSGHCHIHLSRSSCPSANGVLLSSCGGSRVNWMKLFLYVCAFVFSSPCSLPEKHHTLDVCALLFCWRWGPGFATLACCGPLFRRYLSVFVVRLGSSNCLPWPHCRG